MSIVFSTILIGTHDCPKYKYNIITVFTIYVCTEEGGYENKHIRSAQNYFIHHECVIYYWYYCDNFTPHWNTYICFNSHYL